MSDWNQAIVEEFRANDGVVGGHFEGRPLLLLHTVGRKSGTARVTPLTYLEQDGRIFIFGSAAGSDNHPAWYLNLMAHPEVRYEVGTETRSTTARELTGRERDAIYRAQVEVWDVFGRYEAGTDRIIPVIELS